MTLNNEADDALTELEDAATDLEDALEDAEDELVSLVRANHGETNTKIEALQGSIEECRISLKTLQSSESLELTALLSELQALNQKMISLETDLKSLKILTLSPTVEKITETVQETPTELEELQPEDVVAVPLDREIETPKQERKYRKI
jgi:predicted  nucleic acid-binding Zn-ribbon protein